MQKKFKIINSLLLFFIFCLVSNLVLGANDKLVNLQFTRVVEQALQNDYDLKIAEQDIKISKAQHNEIRAELWPKLYLRAYSDYTSDLTTDQAEVVVIGDQVFGDESKFQTATTLKLNYLIFDSGLWNDKQNFYEKEILKQKLNKQIIAQQLKIQILELYKNIWLNFEALSTQKKLLVYKQESADFYQRLYKAGKISKLKVADAKIDLKNSTLETMYLKEKLKDQLQELAIYTGENYHTSQILVQGFTDISADSTKLLNRPDIPLEITQRVDYKKMETEIAKKKLELEMLQKGNKLKINLEGEYLYYAADYTSLRRAWANFLPKTWVIRMTATYPLFQGFAESAQAEKIKMETKKWQLKKEKLFWETKLFYQTLVNKIAQNKKTLQHNQKKYLELSKKAYMLARLKKYKLIEKVNLWEQKMGIEQMLLEQKKLIIKTQADLLKYFLFLEG